MPLPELRQVPISLDIIRGVWIWMTGAARHLLPALMLGRVMLPHNWPDADIVAEGGS
jgi:hypothetical protein